MGSFSDRDLYKALSPNIGTRAETFKDAATLNKRVHQIVSRNPLVLTPSATIDEAISVFNMHTISCIQKADCENEPLRIITVRDILKALGDKRLTLSP